MAREDNSKATMFIVGGCLGVGCLAGLVIVGGFIVMSMMAANINTSMDDIAAALSDSVADTFLEELEDGAKAYENNHGSPPNGFTDFVTTGELKADEPYTVSTSELAIEDAQCRIDPEVILCDAQLESLKIRSIEYQWRGGDVTYIVNKSS